MSHQTGIKANEKLKEYFAKCNDGLIRLIQVGIENEELVLWAYKFVEKGWKDDYLEFIKNLINPNINIPCYIFFRFDSKNSSGYDWLFIYYCPNSASVREKMLYASTKATVKLEFGTSNIKEELFGTHHIDVTYEGYVEYKKNIHLPGPLTMREEELQAIKKSEVNTEYNVDSKHQTLSGIAFPITEDAKQAIREMAEREHNYLQFKIDVEEEKIHLVKADNISLDKLPYNVPLDCASYHLYLFKHTHEGDCLENIVFIYSIPLYNKSIKERMLYSCGKAHLTELIESLGIEIVKKLEISDREVLTEEFLQDELHPKTYLHCPKFAKPKGPPNRGAKRLTKPQTSDQ